MDIRYFLLFIIVFIISFSYAQDAPPSPIIGDELIPTGEAYVPPAGPPLNPDAQLYLPETFSPTDILPPPRARETIAEQTNAVVKPPPIFSAGFTLGAQYGQFDKLPYTDIYLSPYMRIAMFYISYDIPLRFDWNSAFVTRMWSSSAALVSKMEMDLYYAKTNHTFQNIQLSVYEGEELFQGHGRFFYDYNPNLYNPYEPFKTLKFNLDASYIGLNYFLANIAQPDLMGGEIYIRPLAWLKSPQSQYYSNLKIYALYGVDLDPFQGFSEVLYKFSPNPNSPSFSMLEIGIDIPIYQTPKKLFALDLYGDYAHIFGAQKDSFTIQEGSGISGGVLMTFIENISLRFEMSKALGHWQPRWVNEFYYVDRPYINQGGIVRQNKFMTVTPDLTYFTANIGYADPKKGLFAQMELYGDLSHQDLWFTISFTMANILIKKLSFSFNWTMRDLYNISTNGFFSPQNTIIEMNLKYHMMPNMYWGILVKINGRLSDTFDESDQHTITSTSFMFLGMDFSFRY